MRDGQRRGSVIERVLKRVEDRVEECRRGEGPRGRLQAHRAELWAEAAERQRLLAEALAEERPTGLPWRR